MFGLCHTHWPDPLPPHIGTFVDISHILAWAIAWVYSLHPINHTYLEQASDTYIHWPKKLLNNKLITKLEFEF
jgi:hypothetical protein